MLVALISSSCTTNTEPRSGAPGTPENTPTPSASSTPATVVRASLVGVNPVDLPVLPTSKSGMPEKIPPMDAELPSLLDDLPGRAVLVVNPKITTLNIWVESWSDLDLLFYGIDGRWRRLSLDDLQLPESLIYSDTYGSGQLSSDGRWWSGPSSAGTVTLNLATGQVDTVPGHGIWVRGQHALLTSRGRVITVPEGRVVARVPYPLGVGYEPDGTPLSLMRDKYGQAVLVEWRGTSRHTRAVVPGATPPRFAKPPGTRRRFFFPAELAGVAATTGQFATYDSRGRNRVAVVAADSATGDTIGEVTFDRRDLRTTYTDTWLDDQTLLIATVPYFLAWRPSTGELFRVTDARSMRHNLWDLGVAADTSAR